MNSAVDLVFFYFFFFFMATTAFCFFISGERHADEEDTYSCADAADSSCQISSHFQFWPSSSPEILNRRGRQGTGSDDRGYVQKYADPLFDSLALLNGPRNDSPF